jgi:hypothetical protein
MTCGAGRHTNAHQARQQCMCGGSCTCESLLARTLRPGQACSWRAAHGCRRGVGGPPLAVSRSRPGAKKTSSGAAGRPATVRAAARAPPGGRRFGVPGDKASNMQVVIGGRNGTTACAASRARRAAPASRCSTRTRDAASQSQGVDRQQSSPPTAQTQLLSNRTKPRGRIRSSPSCCMRLTLARSRPPPPPRCSPTRHIKRQARARARARLGPRRPSRAVHVQAV